MDSDRTPAGAAPASARSAVGKRAPKVTHLVGTLKMGGAERFVVDLLRVQRRSGLDVNVISLGAPGDELVAEAETLGAQVLSLRGRGKAAQLLSMYGALRDVKIVHVHSPWVLRLMAPILPVLPGRLVYTRHGSSRVYSSWQWRALHRFARAFGHALTFVNDASEEVYLKIHGPWRRPSQVIENGVDLDVPMHRTKALDGRLRLGSVGRLVELKGQRHLLSALSQLPQEVRARVSVQIFGSGPEDKPLREQAAGVPDVPVVFHGTVLDRERMYGQIDVLCVTSRMEGLSLAIMEAMARGIPVLATDVGGNGRLVLDGQTGLLMPYGDTAALAAALTRVASEDGLLQRLGQGARAHLQAHYSLESTAARYRQIYGV